MNFEISITERLRNAVRKGHDEKSTKVISFHKSNIGSVSKSLTQIVSANKALRSLKLLKLETLYVVLL